MFEHNAITLFQPCEIENLLRGSAEPINVAALRGVTRYKHWGYYHVDVDNALSYPLVLAVFCCART